MKIMAFSRLQTVASNGAFGPEAVAGGIPSSIHQSPDIVFLTDEHVISSFFSSATDTRF